MEHDVPCRPTDGVVLRRRWACHDTQCRWERVRCRVDGKVVPQRVCGFEHKGGLCRQEVCSQHHVDAKGSTALWVGLAGHESTSTLGPFLRNEMYRNDQSE